MLDDDRALVDEYERCKLQAGFLAKLPLRGLDRVLVDVIFTSAAKVVPESVVS